MVWRQEGYFIQTDKVIKQIILLLNENQTEENKFIIMDLVRVKMPSFSPFYYIPFTCL